MQIQVAVGIKQTTLTPYTGHGARRQKFTHFTWLAAEDQDADGHEEEDGEEAEDAERPA